MADATEPIRDPAVIEALARLVGAKKTETRIICATSLGHAHVSEARAIELLERLARDPEPGVRTAAAQSLSRLAAHTPLAVPAVQRSVLASSEPRVLLAAIWMLVNDRCTHLALAPVLAALAVPSADPRVATAACRALWLFPPDVSLPLLRQILRACLALPRSALRDVALEVVMEMDSAGPQEPGDILDLFVATIAPREAEADADSDLSESTSDWFFEARARRLLPRVLAGPVPTQSLFQLLATARRPSLRLFAPRLVERLGGAPLEPETLAALQRGLASRHPPVCANALTLWRCAPAQLHLAEPRLVSLLASPQKALRTLAAEALRALDTLEPSSLEALAGVARAHAQGPDGQAAREALGHHAAPVPLPAAGLNASTLLRGLLPLAFLAGEDQLLDEEGALYIPRRCEDESEPGEPPRPRAETFGLARLRLGAGGPALETFPVPWRPPRAPPPGIHESRKLRLALRLGEDFLCLLSRRHYARGRGVQMSHCFLLFHPATRTWSQALPSDRGTPSPAHRVALDEHLEDAERCVGGRRYLVWKDRQGRLQGREDFTNYDSVEYETKDEVREAYAQLLAAHRAATHHHALEVDPLWSGQEPWTLSLPNGPSSWRLYGVRMAVLEHHPQARALALELRGLRYRAAHRLTDVSGRQHLVLFVEARMEAEDARALAQRPREHALLILEAPPA